MVNPTHSPIWPHRIRMHASCLFFETAADYLAPLLARGEEPESHYKQWSEANQQRLAFLRRHRGRAMLIDYVAARRDPVALAAICGQVGLELPVPHSAAPWEEKPLVVERWLARQWLEHQAETEMLEAELEASAHPLADEPATETILIDALLNAYSQRVTHDRVALEQARGEIDTLSAEKGGVVEENELLLLQLHQVQEELEATFLENRKLQQDSAALEKTKGEIDALKQEKDELAAQSVSQRGDLEVSEKQRREAVQSAETMQTEKDDLVEENELLLLQLHQVQEELEVYFLENQKLKAPIDGSSVVDVSSNSAEPDVAVRGQHAKTGQASQPKSLWSRYAEWRKLRGEMQLLSASDWFDAAWYLQSNTDVAEAGMDAVEHYLRFGAAEGRNPSPRFNTRDYLNVYTDVAEAGENPLVHYLRFGKDEGRAPAPSSSAW